MSASCAVTYSFESRLMTREWRTISFHTGALVSMFHLLAGAPPLPLTFFPKRGEENQLRFSPGLRHVQLQQAGSPYLEIRRCPLESENLIVCFSSSAVTTVPLIEFIQWHHARFCCSVLKRNSININGASSKELLLSKCHPTIVMKYMGEMIRRSGALRTLCVPACVGEGFCDNCPVCRLHL